MRSMEAAGRGWANPSAGAPVTILRLGPAADGRNLGTGPRVLVPTMPILRLLLAGLIALGAIFAAMLAAAVVMFGALLALLTGGRFRVGRTPRARPSGAGPGPVPRPGPRGPAGVGDVIDIEARRVPDRTERLP